MAFIVAVLWCILLQGADSQYTVTIVSSPAGTPVSGSTNTFEYPIFGSVTLTCNVMADSGSLPNEITYQWDTTGCYTNSQFTGSNPECFPHGQSSQSVIGNDLNAEDAGTITCTARISSSNYKSASFTLRISGVAVIRNSLTDDTDFLTDYSYINAPGNSTLIASCVTGLGPTGTMDDANGDLGGWYFINGTMIPNSDIHQGCGSPATNTKPAVGAIQARPGLDTAGVINLRQCDPFTIALEGIYTCTMMNSSMMDQSVRLGVYFSVRTAPVIDSISSNTMTINVGDPLTLSCISRGSPPDTFTWRKDNGPVLQSITTPVTYNDSSAVFRVDYSIDSVTTSDSGTYTCTVTNPIGSDSATITVIVSIMFSTTTSVVLNTATTVTVMSTTVTAPISPSAVPSVVPSNSNNSSDSGAITGGAVGGVILLLMIIAVLCIEDC